MDWISGLQEAINYIEINLTEELDYTEIAKKAYSSSFHFQRVFSILCGYTLGEYIRSRRLTLAASELVSSNIKVIDIALKYGYDSPESFCRAFTKFHGITPSQAKSNNAKLKSFSRLSVKLILEGGSIMDYKIEKKEAFKVIAKKQHFLGGQEFNKQQIFDLWDECRNNGTIEKLCSYIKPSNVFNGAIVGMSFSNPNEDDFDYAIGTSYEGDFDYAIGTSYEGGKVDSDLSIEEVPACTWVIFKCVGAMTKAFDDLFKQIYTEFFPTSEYQPSHGIFFEVYFDDNVFSENYVCEMWIPVEKK